MGLADEVRLYESLWDESKKAVKKTSKKHALTQAKKYKLSYGKARLHEGAGNLKDCYIILTGDFPNSYFVHGIYATEPQARSVLSKIAKEFSGDIELAQLFDLTQSQAAKLASMAGKEVTGADADFIAQFFTDGSRVDSLQNNFFEDAATNKTPRNRKNILKEAAPVTASSIISRYNNNVADHILELEHEKEFNDAEWFEDNWYVLQDVEVHPNYYKLIVDRSIDSDIDAEAIISYAFEPATIVGMDEAMSEGGVVYDQGGNWIYVERWVVTGQNYVTESLLEGTSDTSWQDLLTEADKLLDEICDQSGNGAWDDGDGYWSGTNEWTNRYIFYGRLANIEKLQELCDLYSAKLNNIEFYFFDDEQDEISEIGYIATRSGE